MKTKTTMRARAFVLLTVVAVTAAVVGIGGSAGAAGSVRGFDGSTITVAGLGLKSQLAGGEIGARARIKRFNDTNEIKGVKIDYTELADDKGDPATSLSEARRLVTQTGIFAVVGDVSTVDPVDYLTQQHVPVFGGGFGTAYCSPTATTKLWFFAVAGCLTNPHPSFVNDNYKAFYTYVSQQTKKKHPTLVMFGNDTETGKAGNAVFSVAAQGAGFKVVSQQSSMPLGGASDYTPYVQAIKTADHGKQPDATFCTGDVSCVSVWQLLQASGYTGVFGTGLYTDILVKPLKGSSTQFTGYNFGSDTPGMKQVKADLDAYQAGAGSKLDVGTFFGYNATDFFIQVLKKVAAKGKSDITPENVQKVASTFTWQLPGVSGPTQYPKSTVLDFPACLSAMADDGTAWQTVVPFKCSTKTYPPNLKLG